MQEIVLEIRYFERGLSKSLKKKMNPISFNEQDHEKQKESETSDQSLEMKSFLSNILVILLVAITFSLACLRLEANCELN